MDDWLSRDLVRLQIGVGAGGIAVVPCTPAHPSTPEQTLAGDIGMLAATSRLLWRKQKRAALRRLQED